MSTAGGGDRQPVAALSRALHARGNGVTVLCDRGTSGWFADSPIRVIEHDVDQVGYITMWATSGEPGPPNPFVVWGRDAFPSVADTVRSLEPDIIVSALFTMGLAEMLAAELDVPWVFVNPSFYFGEDGPRPIEDDWHGSTVPRLVRECFLPLVARADMVLHATEPRFDPGPSALAANHHYVGFLITEPESDPPSWLATPGDPFALVTGSTARPKDEIIMLQASVDALADRPVRAIVTLPRPYPELSLPPNATAVGFVAHTPVLERAVISINQAGHGIVSKCISNGVPMVLMPWDADQPGVAARAAAMGVAEVVPRAEVTASSVARAVGRVLDEPGYRESGAEVAAEIAGHTPLVTAAELVESL